MSFVATAVVGSIAIGAGSAYLGARSQSKAADKAAKAQTAAAKSAEATQLYMYDTSRRDFMPFTEGSGRAMATLQSGVYGTPMQYADPRYSFDRDSSMYIGPKGEEVEAPPMLTATYRPTESEGFKYAKQRTMNDLGRQLRMMGRGNSTLAANTYGRTLGDLNLANEQQYYNRLADLVKTGQGAAGTIGGLGANTAGNVSNIMMTAGDNAAQNQLAQGQIKSNLYQGLGQLAQGTMGSFGQYKGWW